LAAVLLPRLITAGIAAAVAAALACAWLGAAAVVRAAAPAASPIALRCKATPPAKLACRASGATALTWSFGDGRTAAGASATVKYRRTGGFYVFVRGKLPSGKTGQRVAFVLVTRTGIAVKVRG
jgi:hypothetical protein